MNETSDTEQLGPWATLELRATCEASLDGATRWRSTSEDEPFELATPPGLELVLTGVECDVSALVLRDDAGRIVQGRLTGLGLLREGDAIAAWLRWAEGVDWDAGDDEPSDMPYVCPGCHAVGEQPCLPGCIDAEIEESTRHAIESGDYDLSEDDDDDT